MKIWTSPASCANQTSRPLALESVRKGSLELLVPNGAEGVVFTTRDGGVSFGPYRSLNLGPFSTDAPRLIEENRKKVSETIGVDEHWVFARQLHGAEVFRASSNSSDVPEADIIVAVPGGPPVLVSAADCLPIAIQTEQYSVAVHAGRRGIAAGGIERAVDAVADQSLFGMRAWIGPSIGPCHYEVGEDVVQSFRRRYPVSPEFWGTRGGSIHFDLRAAARWALRGRGVVVDEEDPPCTHCDPRFFSHRRDGETGRQVLLLWR